MQNQRRSAEVVVESSSERQGFTTHNRATTDVRIVIELQFGIFVLFNRVWKPSFGQRHGVMGFYNRFKSKSFVIASRKFIFFSGC
mmetsp:Transcript_3755/g.6392  ORF Transcript_3755/g.6392 Transcript_3755/m.6392 type:complete len:85 (+) Transcript_3755:157-411(+)